MKADTRNDRTPSIACELAERLGARRRERGLTQGQVAVRLGISRQAVSKWEHGQSAPDLDNLARLADLFGCTVDELLGGAVSGDGPGDRHPEHQQAPAMQTPAESERIASDRRFIAGATLGRGALIGLGLALMQLAHDPSPRQDAGPLACAYLVFILLCAIGLSVCNLRYTKRGGPKRIILFDLAAILMASIVPHALGGAPAVLAVCGVIALALTVCSTSIYRWWLLYQRVWNPVEDLRDPWGRSAH